MPHLSFLIIDAAQERKTTGGKGCGINSGEQRIGTTKLIDSHMIRHGYQFS